MSYSLGFDMQKKAAVFGSAGQLGLELVRELSGRGYRVTGWDRKHLDITDARRVEQALVELDPAVVFNAVAYNQVDVAEEEPRAAYEVNALAVRHIAVVCRQIDARLVHFSTDYVFDGCAGRPYTEQDATHPLGAYAVSKLAGELYAQAYLNEPLIVRTSGVFGPGALETARGNFVELMLRLAHSRQRDPRGGRPCRLAYLRAAAGRPHGRPGGAQALGHFSCGRRHAGLLVRLGEDDLPPGGSRAADPALHRAQLPDAGPPA